MHRRGRRNVTSIRKSGAFAAYAWDRKIADPRDQEFADALAIRRFRTIENAASEEISAGWVTPEDPTGNSFALEDLDGGAGTWLRFRTDTKKLPIAWLQQHRAAAEKARGKKLSARERRELKDDLMEKLLPRVLPTTRNTDALLFHDRRLVLVFAGGKSARDVFTKLFFESFGVPLMPLGPLQLALQVADKAAHDAIAKLEPTKWPAARRAS
jgi:DNA recombination-dependent growth factor C